MTAVEIFKATKQASKKGSIYYIEFMSKQKLGMIEKLIAKFENDAKLDYDLGIINLERLSQELKEVALMRESAEQARERNSKLW